MSEHQAIRDALKFYAERHHFVRHDPNAWDTVSGEPQNFYEDESGTATVEDGSVARQALDALARLEAAPQPAIPPGYKLVPVEPTAHMVMEGASRINAYGGNAQWAEMETAYQAMLKATPKPEYKHVTDQPGVYPDLRAAANAVHERAMKNHGDKI